MDMNTYFITGTFTGMIIQAPSEGTARRTFHSAMNGESIVSLSANLHGATKRKRLQGYLPWEDDRAAELSILGMDPKFKPLIP